MGFTQRRRTVSLRQKLTISMATVCSVVLLAELGLRLVKYGEEDPDVLPPAYVRVYDRYRGFFLKPNQTIHWSSSCFDISGIEINDFGMRDRPRRIDKNGPRIALLGDSFLRAFEVDNGAAINRVLERELPGVECLNFGESGYGTLQSYQTYVTFASRFRPDVVIYFMYMNDVIENHYLLRAWRTGITAGVHPGGENYPDVIKNQDGVWEWVRPDNLVGATSLRSIRGWLKRHFRIYVVGSRAKAGLIEWRKTYVSRRMEGVYPAAESVPYSRRWMELAVEGPPKNRHWVEAWEITTWAITQLAEAAKADGALFLVVGIPLKDVLRIQKFGFSEVTGLQASDAFEPGYLYRTIGVELRRRSIPFLNLQDAYYQATEGTELDPLLLYHDCNPHWNERGHRVTAELVAKFIKSELKGKLAAQLVAQKIGTRPIPSP